MAPSVSFALTDVFPNRSPHLGIGYLRSVLEERGIETHFHDFSLSLPEETKVCLQEKLNGWPTLYASLGFTFRTFLGNRSDPSYLLEELDGVANAFAEVLLSKKPDWVGFSLYQSTLLLSLLTARKIKEEDPEIGVLFGGPLLLDASIRDVLTLFPAIVDGLFVGEAEGSIGEFLEAWEAGANPDGIPGCIDLRGNGGAGPPPYRPRPLRKDLDTLPPPLFEGVPFEEYRKNVARDPVFPGLEDVIELPISGSRGCTHRCSFCGESRCWDYFRIRRPEEVAEELALQLERYGARTFKFNDSLLNSSKKWILRLCNEVIDRGLEVYWYGNFRTDRIDEEVASRMYQAGCRYLKFGVESGSDRVLERMNKGNTAEEGARALRIASSAGLLTRANFIYGFPGESVGDFLKTLLFWVRNRRYISRTRFLKFGVLPDADVTVHPEKYGITFVPFEDEFPDGRISERLRGLPKAIETTPLEELREKLFVSAIGIVKRFVGDGDPSTLKRYEEVMTRGDPPAG
jgi:hypothetical protein